MRALFVCLLLLSGCLGEQDPREPPGEPPRPGPTGPPSVSPAPDARTWRLRDFGFDGCQGIEVKARVDAQAAQAMLGNDTVATPHDAPLEAVARWRILDCQNFTARSGSLHSVLYGDVALAIEGGWYRFAIFSHEDNLAAAWRVAGYEVVAANATMEDEVLGPIRSIHVELDGYTTRFAAATATDHSGHQELVTDSLLGRIVWNETVEFGGVAGAGTWAVPESDPFHGLLADGRAVAFEWTWYNGVVADATVYRETNSGGA